MASWTVFLLKTRRERVVLGQELWHFQCSQTFLPSLRSTFASNLISQISLHSHQTQPPGTVLLEDRPWVSSHTFLITKCYPSLSAESGRVLSQLASRQESICPRSFIRALVSFKYSSDGLEVSRRARFSGSQMCLAPSKQPRGRAGASNGDSTTDRFS